MITIALNDPRIVAANLPQTTSGNIVFFQTGTDKRGNPIEVSVMTDGNGNLQFFPDRSYVQQQLMVQLGVGSS